jgi:uncharacterized RmlC-like cupin family protein
MAAIEAISPDELAEGEGTPGIDRKVAFETGNNIVVQAHVDGGVASGWHHHGNRHVYGYVVEGSGAIEYGPDGDETRESTAGEFFYISPGTVHRDVTPDSEDTIVLVCFVGSGSVVMNVDGPGAD